MAAPRTPQDRKTPVKRTTRKTAAPAAPSPAERIEAEAAMIDDTREWVPTQLPNGQTIRMLPMSVWSRSVYNAVANGGNFEALAAVVHEDDRDTWADWDCPIGELMEFAVGLVIEGGQEVGEAVASRYSSRSTRRR